MISHTAKSPSKIAAITDIATATGTVSTRFTSVGVSRAESAAAAITGAMTPIMVVVINLCADINWILVNKNWYYQRQSCLWWSY
jgi:hypothetical protein